MDDAFTQSLCRGCRWLRLVAGARSTFYKCNHPELPRYPRQPVFVCRGFEAAPPAQSAEKVEE
jgi:hypothetical protein